MMGDEATLQVPSLRLKVPSLRDIFSLFTYGNPDGVITRGQLLTFVRQMGGVESILDAFIVETEDKISFEAFGGGLLRIISTYQEIEKDSIDVLSLKKQLLEQQEKLVALEDQASQYENLYQELVRAHTELDALRSNTSSNPPSTPTLSTSGSPPLLPPRSESSPNTKYDPDFSKTNEGKVQAHSEGSLPSYLESNETANAKLLILIQVLRKYLQAHLIATPLVYIGGVLKSYSEFRSTKRKQLEALELAMKNTKVPANQVLDNYTAILCDVLKVRIPAMPDFYVNDFQHARENVNKATGDIILSIDQSASIEFKERVLEVARALLKFLTYSPVGRPHIYASDSSWGMVSEKVWRMNLRHEIIR